MMRALQHSYAELPGRFYAPATLRGFEAPELIAFNEDLAETLGLCGSSGDPAQRARWFSGSEAFPGAKPISLAYAGHQFGQFVPRLGDGRAALLGEALDENDQKWDLQLKGSGRTPFSRGGDGLSSLGPVLREYLLSEAMHRLKVPTTRALAAVVTGETVLRRQPEPGGVFTRVAASHLRIGSFQYLAAQGDREGLKILADYAIERHDPLAAKNKQPYLAFFRGVVDRQSRLVAQWLSIGFIHGVMNTDNTAISGETLDYGPCALMDEYRHLQTFSSIDQQGRYAYGNQPTILHWNLARLAECLLVLDEDLTGFQEALDMSPVILADQRLTLFRQKLGLVTAQKDDAALVDVCLQQLEQQGLDFTLSFRQLSRGLRAGEEASGAFETRWRDRLAAERRPWSEISALMDSVNPLYIPRNHQVERAIETAFQGDYSVFNELSKVLRTPFEQQQGMDVYAAPPRDDERVTATFCGT